MPADCWMPHQLDELLDLAEELDALIGAAAVGVVDAGRPLVRMLWAQAETVEVAIARELTAAEPPERAAPAAAATAIAGAGLLGGGVALGRLRA